ncbi:MAG TPA: amidohydrolase family protein [Candidatus Binatia bacterium]|jgi:predicted TIM-barrel fold metal-dependent hydrolase|nr:amidohydrolase family protein [Candidatus Binatia bacterium]
MTDDARPLAIDCWLNPTTGLGDHPPEYLVRVARDYFKREKEMFAHTPIEELLAQMDRAGVERAIVTMDAHRPEPVAELARAFPGKFICSAVIDPTTGMESLRLLERLVAKHGLRLARVVPFLVNRPPNDKVYYPLYAKCIELDLPISVNTGIPGPPMPAEPQRPLHLDEVCLFYPEAKIVMAHGADPWWGEAIRLLLKYPNLYMMTSAYAPKYLPPELIHFMNTRGSRKILFASDHPVLSFERCLAEAAALPLRDGVLGRYLRDNALELFRWE